MSDRATASPPPYAAASTIKPAVAARTASRIAAASPMARRKRRDGPGLPLHPAASIPNEPNPEARHADRRPALHLRSDDP